MGAIPWLNRKTKIKEITNSKPYDLENIKVSPGNSKGFVPEQWLKDIKQFIDNEVAKEIIKGKNNPQYTPKTRKEIEKYWVDQKIWYVKNHVTWLFEKELKCFSLDNFDQKLRPCCDSFYDRCGVWHHCIKNENWEKDCCKYEESLNPELWAKAREALAKLQSGVSDIEAAKLGNIIQLAGGLPTLLSHDKMCGKNQNGQITRIDRIYLQIAEASRRYKAGLIKNCKHDFIFIFHDDNKPWPKCSYPWYTQLPGWQDYGCVDQWWSIYTHIIVMPVNEGIHAPYWYNQFKYQYCTQDEYNIYDTPDVSKVNSSGITFGRGGGSYTISNRK